MAEIMNSFYEKYDISCSHGFLTQPRIPAELPSEFVIFNDVIANLGNPDGVLFRKLVDGLTALNHPQEFYIEMANRQNREVQKEVYSIFTFIVQKYVRCLGKDGQVDTIPFEIGLIWYHTAETFKLPTVTTYSALVLTNWRLIDPSQPFTLDNVDAIRACSGTDDERWFYRVHMSIEKIGAEILREMHDIEETTVTAESTLQFLIRLEDVILRIRENLARMRTGCDPANYWNIVRIFLGGYTPENGLPNGLNIRNTQIKDIKYGGGSAAQSSLIQSLDAFLGVKHPTDKAKDFLMQQRAYMPERHVAYLRALDSHTTIRDIVVRYDNDAITEQYNAVMQAFGKFRATHYGIVHEYVVRFTSLIKQRTESGDVAGAAEINKNNIYGSGGSGGTVLKMLDEYRCDTIKCQIKPAAQVEAEL
mmetsp:Transcript_5495/g.11137  ORF Transcript_5495/g.11137 Transcript_5495/m.11137 type:complete len:419 (+) Transcript_5495:32-1288(+)